MGVTGRWAWILCCFKRLSAGKFLWHTSHWNSSFSVMIGVKRSNSTSSVSFSSDFREIPFLSSASDGSAALSVIFFRFFTDSGDSNCWVIFSSWIELFLDEFLFFLADDGSGFSLSLSKNLISSLWYRKWLKIHSDSSGLLRWILLISREKMSARCWNPSTLFWEKHVISPVYAYSSKAWICRRWVWFD